QANNSRPGPRHWQPRRIGRPPPDPAACAACADCTDRGERDANPGCATGVIAPQMRLGVIVRGRRPAWAPGLNGAEVEAGLRGAGGAEAGGWRTMGRWVTWSR